MLKKKVITMYNFSNTSEGYIGFHDADNNGVFVWLNGKVLANDHPNWDSGRNLYFMNEKATLHGNGFQALESNGIIMLYLCTNTVTMS